MSFLRRLQYAKLVAADFAAAVLAWAAFFGLQSYMLHGAANYAITGAAAVSLACAAGAIGLAWTGLYALLGQYRDVFRKSRLAELLRLLRVSALGVATLFFVLLLGEQGTSSYDRHYRAAVTYFLLHYAFTAVLRIAAVRSVQRLVRRGIIFFPTLLVGGSALVLDTARDLARTGRHLGLRVVGFVAPEGGPVDEALAAALPALGTYQQLPALVPALRIEEVIIAIEASEHGHIQEIINILEDSPVRISILPDLHQILLGSVKVNHSFGTPLIEIKHDLLPPWQAGVKRLIDVVGALLFLGLGCWVYAIAAGMVRLSSPGPVFYWQERVGKNGRPFRIFKFRSMYLDAEQLGPSLSSDHDPRITPWGRFMRRVRLDELPQFWNVLRGEMSVVGPRPERQFFIDQIVKVAPHYRHLHRVRPGLTSLGQVKYGYAETVPQMLERLKYDILYIENMSLAMDFRVMLYTLKIILEGRGK